jgi:hypothetical protein
MRSRTFITTTFLILATTGIVRAQDVRASISGIVTDPSGAPVVSATVAVTSVTTNSRVSTSTNETGYYVTPFLTPGAYTLSAERPGFRKFVRENIVLQSLDKARIDVELQIGALTDSVTVTAAVTSLQTETATRGQTLSNELIDNVPTQGRNPFQIAWAAPGVVKTGTFRYLRSFDIGGTSGMSINGGRNKENEVLLDGISNVQADRTVMHVPQMEAVQEFKVLTNTYDSQYGRTGGGIVTIVTKGGGNQFHGNLFEYFQNDKLNANQYELNTAGTKKPPNHINTYGFQLSGPVYLPKVFDGRNKLFWTLSNEAMRQRSADPGVVTVPLKEFHNGDFSGLFNAQGQQVRIYDPLTTQTDGTRQPFAGNAIPAARISPVAKAVLPYFLTPNSAGASPAHTLNYTFPSRWVGDLNQWTGRLDYQVNSKNSVFFRYGENPYSEFRSLVYNLDPSGTNPAESTGNAPLLRNGRNWTWDWTSTLTPTMTFDLRAGLNRWEAAGGSVFGANFDPKQLGFASSLVAQFNKLQFPNFSLGTYQSIGSSSLLNANTHDTYTVQPNLNKVYGRHFLKMGFEARRYNDYTQNPGLASGTYSFDKGWSQAVAGRPDAVSGNEFASFLLGYPASAGVDKNIDPAFTHFYYAAFLQDDWKLTPRLTVNLGLRWDYESPGTERHDRMVRGMDLFAPSPIAAQAKGMDLKGQILFAGVNGQPRGSFDPDKNNFAPRVGVAYRLREKWVVRGGYGLYYLGQGENGSNQGFSQRTNGIISTNALTPAVDVTNAFALLPGGRLLDAVGAGEGAASFLGQGVTVNWLDRPLPYSHQYSFDIQRELPKGLLVEVGYVGNLSRKLPVGVGIRNLPVEQLNRRLPNGQIDLAYYNQQVANPMAGLIPNNAALNGATITNSNFLVRYPQYSGLTVNNFPIGQQRYDSFQSKVTKRFAGGLTFLASYAISKTFEQVSLLNAQDLVLTDPGKTPLDKRLADQIDLPQKFNITGVYELPFGKGKPFAANAGGIVNQFIGGWELNWNVTYMSGWAVNYPNANQVKPGSAKIDNPTIGQWFNTSMWTDPATGRYVALPDPRTLRDFPTRFGDVRTPGYRNWDASVSKIFPIRERLRLQFRFEAVNALNRPWFSSLASVDVTNAQFGRLNPQQSNLPRFMKLGLVLQW